MLDTGSIIFFSFTYIGLLFAIAYMGDRHAEMGRSFIGNAYIYALSLAVYCTTWTYYGSVGRTVSNGPGFLAIYIGPTLMFTLGWSVIRKIIRISKNQRITSIADFIASRYGKSASLGAVVAVMAVLGIVPYISLQLKAVSYSYIIINHFSEIAMPVNFASVPVHQDTAFYVTLVLAVFAILFGTRHLEATQRHEGMVAAIAFESIIKLMAFMAVGAFITYGIYDGFHDLFDRAAARPSLESLIRFSEMPGTFQDWAANIFLSMMAILFLPRQFHMTVLENADEQHIRKAVWLLPLYLLAINIFVIPVALGGIMHFPDGRVDADTFVLTLPLAYGMTGLALFAYIGGISAGTGMIIVETLTLSTMISNKLVMPILIRMPSDFFDRRGGMIRYLLATRRAAVLLILLLGYTYFRFIGEYYPLVSIGLVSFTAVAQFAPSILGGIYWKRATRAGALSGLISGFVIWTYTLFIPSLVQTGLLSESFIHEGPWGMALLRPFQLFGLEGFSSITHALFWSMVANVGAYVCVSLLTRPSAMEHTQAALFVDVFQERKPFIWRGTASIPDLKSLLERFLGEDRAAEALSEFDDQHVIDWENSLTADPELVNYVERQLAGALGSASARVMVASVVKEEPLGIDEVMDILDETRQAITYSRELEKATAELKAANKRLEELDRLKDEFISTVTHELRTPLTSIRSLAEILFDTPDIPRDQHHQFLGIIIKESQRLTRLINQVLDFQKIESGRLNWNFTDVDVKEVIQDSLISVHQLIEEKRIRVFREIPDDLPTIHGDRDRLIQVMVNLLFNAVKFCDDENGEIRILVTAAERHLQVTVMDNGVGIRPQDREVIFEKFKQIRDPSRGRPSGSGLGLTITRQIIEYHQGKIRAENGAEKGAAFIFVLPVSPNPKPTV